MKSKNIIELNGKQYDALTGVVLGAGSAPAVQATRNIDGFFRNPRATTTDHPAPVHHIAVNTDELQKKATSSLKRHGVHHAQPHKPEKAQTLMRAAVRRPEPSLKQQTHIQGSLQHKVPSLIATKQSAYSLNEQRLARAKSIQKSPHIARHQNAITHVPVVLAPLPVQPVPPKPSEPVVPPPQPTNKPLDMFEHAIANAGHFVDVKAHQAHFRKQARRHFASMAAGTFALLVIAGFAVYQNSPGLQLKVASLQAGFSTNMPNLAAAGFAYNGVRAADGKLTVGFSSAHGNYQITQQTTNWSASDMIQNISATDASGAPNYTTVKAGNTTVYRFHDSDATWVSNGKWYTVGGNHSLSDNQVKQLVQNI